MERALYEKMLRRSVDLAKLCPPAKHAFSVGAILFDAAGAELATGYSRETDNISHAEEVVLAKAQTAGRDVRGGTLVCSMEPCGQRKSRLASCAQLIIKSGISRVVYGASEPPEFIQQPTGAAQLKAAGIEVIYLPV